MSNSIVFPKQGLRSEFQRDAVSFPAIIDGKSVLCVASAELLNDQFGANGHGEQELLACASRNKSSLEHAARLLIDAGNVKDGEISITTKSYPKQHSSESPASRGHAASLRPGNPHAGTSDETGSRAFALKELLEVRTAGYKPSTEISRIIEELNHPPSEPSVIDGLVEWPNPYDDARRPWLPLLRESIQSIPDLAGPLTEAKLRRWLWQKFKVPPTKDITAEELISYTEQAQGTSTPKQARISAGPQSSYANKGPEPRMAAPCVSSVSPLEIFYSYAHDDEKLRLQLEKHLSQLKNEGLISGWHDRKIVAGMEWKGQIDDHLNSVQIILLLVSSSFLASHYCHDIELKRAMERHDAREARVIPVILRPCDWHSAPFGKLQATPKDGKAVTTWRTRDEGFLDVARAIRAAIQDANK